MNKEIPHNIGLNISREFLKTAVLLNLYTFKPHYNTTMFLNSKNIIISKKFALFCDQYKKIAFFAITQQNSLISTFRLKGHFFVITKIKLFFGHNLFSINISKKGRYFKITLKNRFLVITRLVSTFQRK